MQDFRADLLERVIRIAQEAAKIIKDVHDNAADYKVEIKADNSPVTLADKSSNDYITPKLTELLDVPILSEEGKH